MARHIHLHIGDAFEAGQRPSPEQMKGLRSFGLRILLSAGSLALTGEATGTVAHVALSLGQELVNHVIGEHGAKAAVGIGRAVIRLRDAAPPVPDELSDEDYRLLQEFIERLAEAAKDFKLPEQSEE